MEDKIDGGFLDEIEHAAEGLLEDVSHGIAALADEVMSLFIGKDSSVAHTALTMVMKRVIDECHADDKDSIVDKIKSALLD